MNVSLRIGDILSYFLFAKDYQHFRTLFSQGGKRFQLKWSDRYPCLHDKTTTSGFDRHYIYHPAWAARILANTKPKLHIDISSTLYFCSIVSAFVPVKFYDYRPANLRLSNLSTGSVDITSLPFEDASIESISCMHVVEHIGLGRYGDALDPDGDLRAISELKRVLAANGNLLFVVPVGGVPQIMFNAHRIYSFEQVAECFADLELMEFALIPDNPNLGDLVLDASRELVDECSYGCGCFWFRKNTDKIY